MDETYNKWPLKKTSVCYPDFGSKFSTKCSNPLKLFKCNLCQRHGTFLKSPESLKAMLKDVENYINTWGLKSM